MGDQREYEVIMTVRVLVTGAANELDASDAGAIAVENRLTDIHDSYPGNGPLVGVEDVVPTEVVVL